MPRSSAGQASPASREERGALPRKKKALLFAVHRVAARAPWPCRQTDSIRSPYAPAPTRPTFRLATCAPGHAAELEEAGAAQDAVDHGRDGALQGCTPGLHLPALTVVLASTSEPRRIPSRSHTTAILFSCSSHVKSSAPSAPAGPRVPLPRAQAGGEGDGRGQRVRPPRISSGWRSALRNSSNCSCKPSAWPLLPSSPCFSFGRAHVQIVVCAVQRP